MNYQAIRNIRLLGMPWVRANRARNRLMWTMAVIVLLVAQFVLTTVPSPAAAMATWQAEYFANQTLSGTPTLTGEDARLDFDWAFGAPATGLPADNFSVR